MHSFLSFMLGLMFEIISASSSKDKGISSSVKYQVCLCNTASPTADDFLCTFDNFMIRLYYKDTPGT